MTIYQYIVKLEMQDQFRMDILLKNIPFINIPIYNYHMAPIKINDTGIVPTSSFMLSNMVKILMQNSIHSKQLVD